MSTQSNEFGGKAVSEIGRPRLRQVWCRDKTYLPAQVMGRWFYLYLILDLYSCKIVGWWTRLTTPSMPCTWCAAPRSPRALLH